jgi:dihydropyrimidinase
VSVLVKGGRIITAADDYVGDIYVEDGRVALIGADLDLRADRTIDAAGKYVLPGCVDPHTHIEFPFGGTVTCDTWTSATAAAAFGGTTSVVDFCAQTPGGSLSGALEDWHAKVENNKPVVDVGFHMAVTDLSDPARLDELSRIVEEEGVTSYKLFMAYKGAVMVDDEVLFKVMRQAHDTGALVMVHAENGDAIDILVKQAVAEGKTEPKWHAVTRPPITEGEATNRAIQLARIADAPLYVVHVSCKEAIDPLARAREADWRAWGETCTQYLFIDQSHLEKPGFEGAKYVYTPPPRPKENQEHLWHALSTGVLSVVSTGW